MRSVGILTLGCKVNTYESNIMKELNGSLVVGYDFTDKDTGVLIIGNQENGKVTVINAFQDKEAVDIFNKLVGRDKNVNTM